MMSRKTRSSDVLFKLEENVFLHKDMLELSLTQQLPTTKCVQMRQIKKISFYHLWSMSYVIYGFL